VWYMRPPEGPSRTLATLPDKERGVVRTTRSLWIASLQPKIGTWREELGRILAQNAGCPRRERLTLIRVVEELRGLGCGGGYAGVRRYAAAWARRQDAATAAAFVPLSFAPGEACPLDWIHEVVLIDGVTTVAKVAQVRLCHGRMLSVRTPARARRWCSTRTTAQSLLRRRRHAGYLRHAAAIGPRLMADETAVDTVFVRREHTGPNSRQASSRVR
jgi:hypothetical protein